MRDDLFCESFEKGIFVGMNNNVLGIAVRETGGKKLARKLRHQGLVPGVIYGAGKAPTSVSVDAKSLESVCYSSSFFSHVIDVKLGGVSEKILPRDIDFNPVTDKPIHVDFQRVSKDSKLRVSIAIDFVNEDKSPGMKRGGVLNIVVHQLECICSPECIPEKVTLDLAGKDIGDGFSINDIVLPKSVEPAHADRDAVIATIVGARTGSSENEQSSTEGAAEAA